MSYCPYCISRGPCKRGARLVDDYELSNPEFLRDVRNFAARLSIRPCDWLDYILDLLSRFDGCLVDATGKPAWLDTEAFLPTDEEIDLGQASSIDARMRNWFDETFSAPVPHDVAPRIRREARERFRVVATTLRAQFPADAVMWGVRAANDNFVIPPTDEKAGA